MPNILLKQQSSGNGGSKDSTKKVIGLKTDKSSQSTQCSTSKVLKEVLFEITNVLVAIFQSSINTGIVPVNWRVRNGATLI